jgi:hypothetical protein
MKNKTLSKDEIETKIVNILENIMDSEHTPHIENELNRAYAKLDEGKPRYSSRIINSVVDFARYHDLLPYDFSDDDFHEFDDTKVGYNVIFGGNRENHHKIPPRPTNTPTRPPGNPKYSQTVRHVKDRAQVAPLHSQTMRRTHPPPPVPLGNQNLKPRSNTSGWIPAELPKSSPFVRRNTATGEKTPVFAKDKKPDKKPVTEINYGKLPERRNSRIMADRTNNLKTMYERKKPFQFPSIRK